jgi:hypothetical protein
MTLKRPAAAQSDPFQPTQASKPCDFWRRAYIDSLSTFHTRFPVASFYLAQDQGEGILITGTRDWRNYTVTVPSFRINLGGAGLAVRVQGLNRYYALVFKADRKSVVLVKARDELRTEVARADFEWELDEARNVAVQVEGDKIVGFAGGKKVLEARDGEYRGGGIGVVVLDGSVAVNSFEISAL